jgi:hypothetical protein
LAVLAKASMNAPVGTLPRTVVLASSVTSIVQRLPIGSDWARPYCA